MPLYDCVVLFKTTVRMEANMDLLVRIGNHVYRRNGVLTDIKSFGTVQLGYGIKKLDGRYYQGTLIQMTMMTPPSFNRELHYLNKDDRLLRWLVVKHHDIKYGLDFFGEDDVKTELRSFRTNLFEDKDTDDDVDDENGVEQPEPDAA